MTHPLKLAPDYVSLHKRKPQRVSTPETQVNEYNAALSLGLSRNYFASKTKNIRVMRLLGAGNVKVGYEKYFQIKDQLVKALNDLHNVLDNRVWGFKVFDHFSGYTERYTQRLKYEIDHSGIINYKKIHFVQKIVKSFQKLEALRENALQYIPFDKRLPLTENFIKKYYWNKSLTTEQIADELVVPEIHIQKEIRRLGMQKKANGIKLRGKRGFVMSEEQKVKHQNQPHARATVQICPRTFKVLRTFNSTGAVERDGWNRENVRKAIKSAGLHDGFLWAYEGLEEEMIKRVKAKGDLKKKLKIWENGHIQKEDLQRLYIDSGLNKNEVAAILGCTPGTVASCASRFGLTKQIRIDDATLKRLYQDEGRSAEEIAEMYGYKVSSIRTYLSKRNIQKYKQ